MWCGGALAKLLACRVHSLPTQSARYRLIHHQLSEAPSRFVQSLGSLPDRRQIVALFYRIQRAIESRYLAAFVRRQLLPCRVLRSLLHCCENRVRLIARLDHLAHMEVLLRIIEGLQDHCLHLLVGESVGGLDLNFSFLAAALLSCRDMQN